MEPMKDDEYRPLFYGESLAVLFIATVLFPAVIGALVWAGWYFISGVATDL
jgi:hypothetical protein